MIVFVTVCDEQLCCRNSVFSVEQLISFFEKSYEKSKKGSVFLLMKQRSQVIKEEKASFLELHILYTSSTTYSH